MGRGGGGEGRGDGGGEGEGGILADNEEPLIVLVELPETYRKTPKRWGWTRVGFTDPCDAVLN